MPLTEARLTQAGRMRGLQSGSNRVRQDHAGGAPPSTYTMFGNTVPTSSTFSDDNAVELCTKFYVTEAGNITALRAPLRGSSSVAMTGHLYEGSTLVRTVTFPTGTDHAWVEAVITPYAV